MKILVLGASGLIGHKLVQQLRPRFSEVIGVLHGTREGLEHTGLFDADVTIENLNAEDWEQVESILNAQKPDVVLNCAGITKRRPEVNEPRLAVAVNALLPHKIAHWAKGNNSRLIHFSTDCVFDGTKGDYTEDDYTSGTDAYGRTKAMGEVNDDHNLTIRSSFIGRELRVHSELLDWFLHQRGQSIGGFSKALYTGISTLEMARIVGDIIEHHSELTGLYQLSMPAAIDKYSLLLVFRDAFGLDVEIAANDSVEVKANLIGDRLRDAIGYQLPSWEDMVAAIAKDPTPYPTLS